MFLVRYLTKKEFPSGRLFKIVAIISILIGIQNNVLCFAGTSLEHSSFYYILIVFVETINVFKLAYIVFLYYTFDSFLDEIMFEHVRDNIHKQLASKNEAFDEDKVNSMAKTK